MTNLTFKEVFLAVQAGAVIGSFGNITLNGVLLGYPVDTVNVEADGFMHVCELDSHQKPTGKGIFVPFVA